ncbi:hypothetical protein WJX73_009558 [Symbiochloris irregularis]|uniref:Uncharacterized protein n=1 Tax=Symbiochloris irregularis TaxID=706552 RepID=A0AAW1PE31_9CHLO
MSEAASYAGQDKTAHPEGIDWESHQLRDSAVWRHLTRDQPQEQRFPGLLITGEGREGFILTVLAPAWRTAPEEISSRALGFLQELESLLDEESEALLGACTDAGVVTDLLNLLTACKMYRNAPAKHREVTRKADQVFGKWQDLVRQHGIPLLLMEEGHRLLKKILRFSSPEAIRFCAPWLFDSQAVIHLRLHDVSRDSKASWRKHAHGACAELLKFSLEQMDVRHASPITEHLQSLESLSAHFTTHPCHICFPQDIQKLVQRLQQQQPQRRGPTDMFIKTDRPQHNGSPLNSTPKGVTLQMSRQASATLSQQGSQGSDYTPRRNSLAQGRPGPSFSPIIAEPARLAAESAMSHSPARAKRSQQQQTQHGELKQKEGSSVREKMHSLIIEGVGDAAEAFARELQAFRNTVPIDLAEVHAVANRRVLEILGPSTARYGTPRHTRARCTPSHQYTPPLNTLRGPGRGVFAPLSAQRAGGISPHIIKGATGGTSTPKGATGRESTIKGLTETDSSSTETISGPHLASRYQMQLLRHEPPAARRMQRATPHHLSRPLQRVLMLPHQR